MSPMRVLLRERALDQETNKLIITLTFYSIYRLLDPYENYINCVLRVEFSLLNQYNNYYISKV